MNRRSFLGWFGATAGTLAVYKELPSSGLAARDAMIEEHSREAKSAECPSNQFVIKNESQKPYVVHYCREGPTAEQIRARHGEERVDELLNVMARCDEAGVKRTQRLTAALLLPGEELTITAVEMQV